MILRSALRAALLTAHVVVSVGWIGAVWVFVALAAAGLGDDDSVTRAAAIAMDLAAHYVITPLSFAAPATGLLLAFGTRWGVLRHYWIVFKPVMTLPATALLTLHRGPIRAIADAAMQGRPMMAFAALRQQILLDASIAAVVLLVVATLGVVKPRGVTPFYR